MKFNRPQACKISPLADVLASISGQYVYYPLHESSGTTLTVHTNVTGWPAMTATADPIDATQAYAEGDGARTAETGDAAAVTAFFETLSLPVGGGILISTWLAADAFDTTAGDVGFLCFNVSDADDTGIELSSFFGAGSRKVRITVGNGGEQTKGATAGNGDFSDSAFAKHHVAAFIERVASDEVTAELFIDGSSYGKLAAEVAAWSTTGFTLRGHGLGLMSTNNDAGAQNQVMPANVFMSDALFVRSTSATAVEVVPGIVAALAAHRGSLPPQLGAL